MQNNEFQKSISLTFVHGAQKRVQEMGNNCCHASYNELRQHLVSLSISLALLSLSLSSLSRSPLSFPLSSSLNLSIINLHASLAKKNGLPRS